MENNQETSKPLGDEADETLAEGASEDNNLEGVLSPSENSEVEQQETNLEEDIETQISPNLAASTAYDILSAGFEKSNEAFEILEKSLEVTIVEEVITLNSKLIESQGNTWKICIIKEGWSLNQRYYPKDVLERDKDKFEGVKIAIYGYYPERNDNFNHLPSAVRRAVPEGIVENTVGWVANVRTEEDVDGKLIVVGDFHCIDEALAKKLANAWAKGKKDLLGFSIDATGEVVTGIAEGKRGLIVNRIIRGNEVTLVDQPAAGGKLLRLIAGLDEEDNNNISQEPQNNNRRENVMDEKEKDVQEALLDEIKKMKDEFANDVAEAKKSAKIDVCRAALNARLKEESFLPKASAMVRKQLDGKIFEEDEMENIISEVRELLASADGGGVAQVAQTTVSDMVEPQDKLSANLDLCFGYNPEKDSAISESKKSMYASIGKPSLKEVYKIWNDDPEMRWINGPKSIQEAVSSDLATTLNNSMGKALFQRYNELPQLWRPYVTINPNVDDFKNQTRIIHSGMGSLFSVGESTSADQYSEMGFFTEDSITYAINQLGATTVITRKMVINDDLGSLREIPRKMARVASKEIHEFVFKMLIGNKGGGGINTDTAYDSTTFYHANHRNLGSLALSHNSLSTAINALSNQYEYGVKTTVSDNPLSDSATTINLGSTTGLKAGQHLVIEAEIIKIGTVASSTQLTGCTRAQFGTTAASHTQNTRVDQLGGSLNLFRYHLIYPMDLRDTVNRVLGSSQVSGLSTNDTNQFTAMVADGTLVPKAIPTAYLGGDQNNWYLIAMPDDIDVFELAFLNNRQTPETWLQDNPTVDNVFKRDNLTYKMRYEFGGTGLDWRGMYASIVA